MLKNCMLKICKPLKASDDFHSFYLQKISVVIHGICDTLVIFYSFQNFLDFQLPSPTFVFKKALAFWMSLS